MDSGFAWAAKNNLVRVNPIHGEEEACLILGDTWQMEEANEDVRAKHTSMVVEDWSDHNVEYELLGPGRLPFQRFWRGRLEF